MAINITLNVRALVVFMFFLWLLNSNRTMVEAKVRCARTIQYRYWPYCTEDKCKDDCILHTGGIIEVGLCLHRDEIEAGEAAGGPATEAPLSELVSGPTGDAEAETEVSFDTSTDVLQPVDDEVNDNAETSESGKDKVCCCPRSKGD